MYWLVGIMSFSILAIIGLGLYLEFRPKPVSNRIGPWLKGGFATNLLLFVGAEMALLMMGVSDALAESGAAPSGAPAEISVGLGLAIFGAGLPTAISTLGAGLAVGTVGAAALAVIAERPEAFGRSLVYLGLAEGIAIYGLVVSILLMGKI